MLGLLSTQHHTLDVAINRHEAFSRFERSPWEGRQDLRLHQTAGHRMYPPRTEPPQERCTGTNLIFVANACPLLAQLARARNSEASPADFVSSGVRPSAGADLRGGVPRLRHSRGRETGKPKAWK